MLERNRDETVDRNFNRHRGLILGLARASCQTFPRFTDSSRPRLGISCTRRGNRGHSAYSRSNTGNTMRRRAASRKGVRNEWHCRASKELSWSELRISQFYSEDGSWFLHQLVAVTPAFEHARFQPARPIGDFAFGNLR